MQSGESEPLDLGLPISNLDGLRVVLDIAENTPDKGKKHMNTSLVDHRWHTVTESTLLENL